MFSMEMVGSPGGTLIQRGLFSPGTNTAVAEKSLTFKTDSEWTVLLKAAVIKGLSPLNATQPEQQIWGDFLDIGQEMERL